MGKVRHVVYCGDAKYVPIIGISMASVVWNNPGEQLCFHLLLEGIRQEDSDRLGRFYALYRNVAEIHVHCIPADCPEMKVFQGVKSSYSVAVNYRLLLPRLLGEDIGEVLYLDGDVICQQSLAPLWQEPLTNEEWVAGVADPMEAMHRKRTGLAAYINSGVLRMNLDAWRQEHIREKALAFYEAADFLGYPDQDAVNFLCAGHIRPMRREYNFPAACNFALAGVPGYIPAEARLVHFVGPVAKPWQVICLDSRATLWERFKGCSFWFDMPVEGGTDVMAATEMRAIRQLLAQGEEHPAYERYCALLKKLGCQFHPALFIRR